MARIIIEPSTATFQETTPVETALRGLGDIDDEHQALAAFTRFRHEVETLTPLVETDFWTGDPVPRSVSDQHSAAAALARRLGMSDERFR